MGVYDTDPEPRVGPICDAERVTEHDMPIDDPSAEGNATSALVEIEPGLAILYSDKVPSGIEVTPFSLLDRRTQGSLNDAIGKASGLTNLAAQGVNGAMQAQGLVRLAPQTLKALETAKPVVSGGWNLGTLTTTQGQFAASVRWLPATSASAASVAASVGPALAMIAIQMQLSEISKLAQHNLEISQIGLEESRQARRTAILGNHRAIVRMVEFAQDQGAVTPAIYKEVRGKQGELESQVEAIKAGLATHVDRLRSKTSNKDRRRYLQDHGEEVLSLAHSLLVAQSTKFTYQALWAGHLLDTVDVDARNAATAKRVIQDGVAERNAVLAETDWLLSLAEREFGVMAELDGKKTIKFSGEARAGKDVARMARQLRDAVAEVRDRSHPSSFHRPDLPTTTVFKKVVPEELPRILAFRLGPSERLLALAEANVDELSLRNFFSSWITLTNERLLIANKEAFKRYAQIRQSVPLDEIRYVRFVEREKGKGPGMDVVTTKQNMRFVFDDWAANGASFDQARTFARVLASFMRLPPEEIPTADIPEVASAETPAELGQGSPEADRANRMS